MAANQRIGSTRSYHAAGLEIEREYIRLRSNCYINSNIIGLVMAPLPCKLKEKIV